MHHAKATRAWNSWCAEPSVCKPDASPLLQVNATGVMPVIFATTLLSLPQAAARYLPALSPVADLLAPNSVLYLPVILFLPSYQTTIIPRLGQGRELTSQDSTLLCILATDIH